MTTLYCVEYQEHADQNPNTIPGNWQWVTSKAEAISLALEHRRAEGRCWSGYDLLPTDKSDEYYEEDSWISRVWKVTLPKQSHKKMIMTALSIFSCPQAYGELIKVYRFFPDATAYFEY
jgi:hypothetical protein